MKWISVKDKHPGKSGHYLASDGDEVAELYFESRRKVNLWLEINGEPAPIDDITHWMPLPKPPTKQGI